MSTFYRHSAEVRSTVTLLRCSRQTRGLQLGLEPKACQSSGPAFPAAAGASVVGVL